MDAVVFSWSGSFRGDLEERREEIEDFIDHLHSEEMEAGAVTEGDRDVVEEEFPELDFVVGNVENIREVMSSLAGKYDKVFLVTDVRAELVTAGTSGAFTVGLSSDNFSAQDLSGAGPNYVIDSLEELERILRLEGL